MNNTELELLKIIADMDGTPDGAYNIRANSGLADRRVTENIDIKTKTDKSGIDIIIKPKPFPLPKGDLFYMEPKWTDVLNDKDKED